ncbi:E3 ubiquitin-protein ligase RBBP6-like isoform X6 [Lytechinus variegatus]|uniref:E3 ubiquitin-protein ligase RBBP6-like isoform X6 n=1 Tax=Lytechinus variegatus TaxID=7654 RepID=UPI001BB2B59A|nr:E3 ubiquitin-protein ligase RBBP6-like isoform X6 [Lytechinus variegatus]
MAENRNVARVRDSDGSPPGLSHKDSDEWGSIADLLKSIESTNQSRCTKVKSPPPPQPRMPPLSENIQSADAGESQRGQGMQQLNHLIRLMDQMCALQRQNSKLREQAEYLAAIKNLHELRNETLRQNCHCEGHRRASDLSSSSGSRFEHTHVTGESLSEPESQMGEDMDGDMAARGEKRGRSSKRDGKNKNIKKRSRSLDPFGDEGDSKDRNKQGLFSKIEKMKEKLTNRRGSVKRRSNSRGDGAKSDDEGEEGKSGPPFHVDGLETKSEDSGIYHIGPDDLAAAARLEAFMQKSTDDISDNEDIFQGTVPLNWARTAVLAQSRRKGSDLSTGSSGEDYLESKPKRTSPSEERKSNLATVSQQETDEISSKRSRFRRTPSCQDNGAAFDDIDGERAVAARSMGPVEEKLKQKRLLQSHSLDIEMTDAGGVSERESGRMSGSEYKQPQKRKYFRKSQTVDVDLDGHSTSSVSVDGAFKDVRSPKASPPEKKKHRGWEKVKHAMTKRHLAEANRQRLMTSSTEESPPVAKRQEMAEDGYLTPGDSTDDGMRKVSSRRGDGSKKSSKRDKDCSFNEHDPLARSSSSKSDLSTSSFSDEFARKLQEWEKMRLRPSGPAPLQKQGSLESGSDVPSSRPVDIESELNKGLTEEFSKKLAEWEKMKKSGYGATSPKGEPKQKRNVKEKKDSTKNSKDKEKQKTKESPLLSRRSKSPEAKLSRNIVVIEDADGQLKLEGASKEFSKRFQEWEKMRSQSSMNTSDSDSPSQRVRKQGSEDSSEPGPQRERAASPRRTDDPSKTTPSRKDNNQAQKKAGATSHEAGSQSEFPDDGRPGDDAVFAEAEEHITKLEEKNTFLATQLKRKDVNLQAVQSELETMQHQLEQIGGSKREPLKLPGRTEAEVQTKQSAPTEDLKRSLQERENIIKLLQTELERQSQEISFLRNQGNTFKRAKSFSARDRTYNPAQLEPSIGWNPALQRNKVKDSTSTISVSESTDSRQDGAPSLEALHISAEDIRMDVDSTKKTAQSSRNTSQSSTSKQNVSSTNKDPDAKSTYPGLYGPIETSSRRRRGNDIKEETSAGQTKAAAQQKKEPEKEVDQPKDESVDEIVARRRARREARRNVRLGIHSAQDKPPIPEPKEEVKPTQTKGTADKMTAKSSSITGPVKAQDSVSESPRVRRRRDRQSGHSTQSPVEAPQEPPLKLPLSPRTRDRQEREVFSDTTNDSEQESISLRSDSDIRRRFESILAHRRRESTDSVSSSRRSSPSGRLYDSNFSRTRTNGDVQNLRKKFTGSSPANVAQAGPVKQKSKSLKYEKERPREGSVKALSQTFGSGDEKKTGGNSNKSSPRSLSPASSSGSLSTGIADKIKKLKNTEEKPIERRKSADLIKARVAQMEQPKDTHSETPQRKSMPAIQAVRSKFEKGGNQDTALSPTRKAGGKISYTVSVTDSDKENSESSRTDDRSYRQKSKSSRLVAVVETADSTKKPDTVTFTVNSHGRRRYGAMADNTNNSNSKHAEPPVTEDLAKPVETEKLKKDDVHTVPTKEEREHKEPKTPSGKREEDAKEGRRRRRERHKASEANKKAQETSKPEPATSEPEKHNTKKNDTKETKAEEPQNKVEKEESKPEVKTDTGKKGRRRRRGKGQSVDIPDEPKQSSQNKPNVEVLQEKGKEKEEKEEKEKEKSEKRYEKKEDVTKPSERHIQKKDKESTLTALKRMVSKREDVRPDVKVRDPTRARLEAENKSSSIDSIEGQDYPDLLAQTRLHDKDKGNSQDEGNGRRRPRSMVAESGLKGAAAAIGQAIPKPESEDKEKEKEKEKEKPKEAEEDDRRSRKETTRRGRFLAKADKFELFRRARSVGPGSKNKERSPSAERKSKGIRSSSIDRSKMRAKSPDPIKSKKKGGSIGGFLKASNSETDDDDEDDDIEYDSEEYDSESDVGSGIDDDTDDDVEDDLWTDMEECYRILFNCHSVLSKLQCRERKHALTWPISAMRQAALLS